MGQKTNPIGLRVAVNKDWRSKWYADKKDFRQAAHRGPQIRDMLKKKLESASVPKILIERAATRCRITISPPGPAWSSAARAPRSTSSRKNSAKMTGKEIYVEIVEVKQPEIDAQLVAENVALQLERRISFRRAMKKGGADGHGFRGRGDQDPLRRAGWAARSWRAWRRIMRAACRCTRCGPTLITVSPRRTRCTASWGSSAGFAPARTKPRSSPAKPRLPPRSECNRHLI
jgi:hypothetical protein